MAHWDNCVLSASFGSIMNMTNEASAEPDIEIISFTERIEKA